MPWGHAAFGYVLYSLGHRFVTREPPNGPLVVLALLFGTQLPDLVDKTLSWGLNLFPQGYSVAHSVFVAVPIGLLVLGATASDRRDIGIAFTLGYWSHLLGDAILAVPKLGVSPSDRLLWPVVTLPPYQSEVTLIGRVTQVISAFFGEVLTTEQLVFLALYSIPYLLVFALWLVDGAPGVAHFLRADDS
ncbi:metal-dependent hydrolase [Haloterrigena sp. SYSU A121-1]|uniref:Metal-dependent hydrolase n=1 Tax=Haloterrigena gelatinilytica TaxID=2741724 RepID=A0A8J8KCT3_9EURY|nr:metal-dependent hydrolase [Haloterrigena gelatinilytica]NUB89443.1 metal-dependent hydrolase [Haloterrigena gelatinilytica]